MWVGQSEKKREAGMTVAHAGWLPAPVNQGIRDGRRVSRLYIHVAFIACLVLQRFGLMLGGSALFISLPVFCALLGTMFVTGHARVRAHAALLYLGFAALALISTLVAIAMPDARFGLSLTSLAAVLITYALAVAGPSERFDRQAVASIFLIYMRVIAVLGIVQWVIQFVGIRIFSLMLTVPPLRPFLVESQFNFDPIMAYGSVIRRSNGLILLEPSIFSQLLVFAIVIDYFIGGKLRWLPLYIAAYVLTFSGTGALALGLALPIYACLSIRNLGRMAGFAVVGVVAVTIMALAVPNQFSSFSSRSTEIQQTGSSSYARFIGPFIPVADLLQEPRSLIGYGPGATERYDYHVEGTGNSVAKLMIDYGVIGLLSFLIMFIGTLWRRDIALMSLVALANFIAGGGYLLFTPILVVSFLLCIWSERRDVDSTAV
jgi:hypothetical protein